MRNLKFITSLLVVIIILIFMSIFLLATKAEAMVTETYLYKYENRFVPDSYATFCTSTPETFYEYIGDEPYVERGSCYSSITGIDYAETRLYATEDLINFVVEENERVFVKKSDDEIAILQAVLLLENLGFTITKENE